MLQTSVAIYTGKPYRGATQLTQESAEIIVIDQYVEVGCFLHFYLQRTLVITTLFVTKDFAVKSNLLLKKKLDMDPSKTSIKDTFEQFL